MAIPEDDQSVELIADRFRLLADPTRLVILRVLMAGELNLGEICERSKRGQPYVSRHLKLMHDSGMVARRKDGHFAYYSIADPTFIDLCRLACEAAARAVEAEIETHRKTLGAYPKAGRPGRR